MASSHASPRISFAALAVIALGLTITPNAARAHGGDHGRANEPPRVVISPRSNPTNASSIEVTVTVYDDKALPDIPTSTPGLSWATSTWSANNTLAVFTATLVLSAGVNSFKVVIEDSDAAVGMDSVAFTYTPPPSSPPTEAAATLSQDPHSSTRRSIACTGCLYGTASYTTPAYVSRDIPRAVTLFYSSAAAVPRGLVQLDATINTSTTPSGISMRLLDHTSAAVSLTNGGTASWYTGATGTIRLGAQFATSAATGVYRYTAGVTTHWGGSSYDATVPVRVFVINEASSPAPVGTGWSIAGVERLVFTGDSVALYDGSTSLSFYQRTGSTTFAATYGAFGTLSVSGGVYTLASADGSWKRYNSSGQITAAGNRFNDSTTFAYSSALLTSITDEVGKTTTFTYAPDGLCPSGSYSGTLCAITDPGGRVSKFVVNSSYDLVAIYDPAGTNVFSGAYSSHRLTGLTDRLGATTSLTYDSFGGLATVTAPSVTTTTTGGSTTTEAPVTTFQSIEAAVLGTANTSSGSARAYVPVDSALAKVIAPNGTTTTMWLQGTGEPVYLSVIPLVGAVQRTTTVYDANYLPQAITQQPMGGTSSFGWEGDTLRWTMDPSGAYTLFFRREHLLVDSVQSQGTTIERNTYSGSSGAYRLATSTRAGVQTQYQWDAHGRLTQDSTSGFKTAYSYVGSGWDNRYEITRVGWYTQATFIHDAFGRDSVVTLANGESNTTTYDLLNRVISSTQNGPAATGVSVSENTGAHTTTVSVTDPRSLVYATASNALGWTTTITDPDANTTTLGYDRNGLLRRAVNRVSGAVTMRYDSLARPVAIVASGDTTAFTYDNAAAHQPHWTVAKTAASRDSVTVDPMGRPTTSVSARSVVTWTLTNTYNGQGDRNLLKVSDGLNHDSLQFGHTVHRYPTHLPDFGQKWTTLHWSGTTGLLDTIRFPTTSSTSTNLLQLPMSYNHFRRPDSVRLTAGSSILENWRYAYDWLGRLIQVDSTLTTDRQYWSRLYTYDARGRLYDYRDVYHYVSDSVDDCVMCGEPTWSYVWSENDYRAVTYAPDHAGNRTDGSASYTGNRLTSMTGADGIAYSFSYDAEGRRTAKTASGYSQTYGWNDLNQLIWVKTNGDSVAYRYDAAGRRVWKLAGGTTTDYVWDGDHLLVELNTSLGLVRKYAYHPGVDRPVALTTGSGATYYYMLDEEGNVRGLWNTSNGQAEVYSYDPYGYQIEGSGSLNQPLRWKGREYDSETGLYSMRARYYDPVVGRFLSEDPIGLAGGINPYTFADGEPVNRADPSGLAAECRVGLVVACQIGGTTTTAQGGFDWGPVESRWDEISGAIWGYSGRRSEHDGEIYLTSRTIRPTEAGSRALPGCFAAAIDAGAAVAGDLVSLTGVGWVATRGTRGALFTVKAARASAWLVRDRGLGIVLPGNSTAMVGRARLGYKLSGGFVWGQTSNGLQGEPLFDVKDELLSLIPIVNAARKLVKATNACISP